MLVLVCGGNYKMLRSVLERIRSFTTDLGTEFLVRDVGDFLIPFMRCIGARVPVAARQQRFLFPFVFLLRQVGITSWTPLEIRPAYADLVWWILGPCESIDKVAACGDR